MGPCSCTQKDPKFALSTLRQRLVVCIETGKRTHFTHLLQKYVAPPSPASLPLFHVNDWIIVLQGVPLNCLAYAYRAGQTEIVKYLIETMKVSLAPMYEAYKRFNRTPVDVACEYGYLDLLEYFLPIHLTEAEKQGRSGPPPTMFSDSIEELSIFSEPNVLVTSLSQDLKSPIPYQPAVQRACENGHIAVVEWLQNYFASRPRPSDFDVNAVDEKAGENCGLVAARQGNLRMIEYLHTKTEADFHAVNRRSENAIQVAASGSKRKDARNYYECLRYLVEKVGVDVTYQYEETLLICEDKALVHYLEAQLQARGISASKARVDSEFAILRGRDPRPLSKHSQELERKLRGVGAKFQIRDLVEDGNEKSYVSSIPQRSVIDVSEFEVELVHDSS